MVIDGSGAGTPQHGVRLDEVTAWTRQQLIFNNRTHSELADKFNRYNRECIVISSPELRSRDVTGVTTRCRS